MCMEVSKLQEWVNLEKYTCRERTEKERKRERKREGEREAELAIGHLDVAITRSDVQRSLLRDGRYTSNNDVLALGQHSYTIL